VSPNGHLDGKPVHLIEPQGYLNFLALEQNAALVITDSGGVQEETTYLDIPCLTIRPNTERPITITIGTNRLIPASKEAIVAAVRETLSQPRKRLAAPELWDGRAAQRIVEVLKHWSLAEAVSWLKDTEVIRPVV
jgi:UDP-N-acetylglucosamine 2-epimerase (non-hydrolysing)